MIRFVNITEKAFLSEYKKLYRFISLERLLETLNDNQLTFINPAKWDDPYEKAFLNAKYYLKGKPMTLPITDKLYCLCWTGTSSSEAYWKGYSAFNDSVRISVLTENLLDALSSIKDFNVWIGKVKYVKTNEILEAKSKKNKTMILSLFTPRIAEQHIKLVLLKRLAFQYEDEIRIILTPKIGYSNPDKNFFKLGIEPVDLFDGYMLHPKFGKHTTTMLKSYFKDHFKVTLKKSNLYNTVNFKISIP